MSQTPKSGSNSSNLPTELVIQIARQSDKASLPTLCHLDPTWRDVYERRFFFLAVVKTTIRVIFRYVMWMRLIEGV